MLESRGLKLNFLFSLDHILSCHKYLQALLCLPVSNHSREGSIDRLSARSSATTISNANSHAHHHGNLSPSGVALDGWKPAPPPPTHRMSPSGGNPPPLPPRIHSPPSNMNGHASMRLVDSSELRHKLSYLNSMLMVKKACRSHCSVAYLIDIGQAWNQDRP